MALQKDKYIHVLSIISWLLLVCVLIFVENLHVQVSTIMNKCVMFAIWAIGVVPVYQAQMS